MKYLFYIIRAIVIFICITFVYYPIKILVYLGFNFVSLIWDFNTKNFTKINKNIILRIPAMNTFGKRKNNGNMEYKYFLNVIDYINNKHIWIETN